MKDPSVRMDGKCRQCEKPRVIPNSRLVDRTVYERDPFCSSQCARQWHGVDGHILEPVVCTGCQGDLAQYTAGCSRCKSREERRRSRDKTRMAA